MIQTEKSKTQRVICFSADKYESFKTANMSKEAFRLVNPKLQPGKNEEIEVKVFKDTELSRSPQKLNFKKTYAALVHAHDPSQDEPQTITLDSINEDYQMVNNFYNFSCQFLETFQKLAV